MGRPLTDRERDALAALTSIHRPAADMGRTLTNREYDALAAGTSADERTAALHAQTSVEALTLTDADTGARRAAWGVFAALAWCQRPRLIGTFEHEDEARGLAAVLARRIA